MDVWAAVDEERSALAEDLSGLRDDQWDQQSLCAEWKVRHVVAHLVVGTKMTAAQMVAGVIRNRLSLDRYLGHDALDAGAAAPEVLLAQFRRTIGSEALPPFTKPACMLADVVCHSADIRRPLGIGRVVPEAALVGAAEFLGSDLTSGTKKRLSATDAAWTVGDGPEVEGPMDALVLAMAGRLAAVGELSGSGLPTLRARVEPSR
jgi:uncharacterized protein (TIGR03083 family)